MYLLISHFHWYTYVKVNQYYFNVLKHPSLCRMTARGLFHMVDTVFLFIVVNLITS